MRFVRAEALLYYLDFLFHALKGVVRGEFISFITPCFSIRIPDISYNKGVVRGDFISLVTPCFSMGITRYFLYQGLQP
ncbi:MAG TPA: hypothetical protein DCR35_05525 [Runella sp.]|nr:hypothetical protein [Runella sp.]